MRRTIWYLLMIAGLASLGFFLHRAVGLVSHSTDLQELEENHAALIKIEYGLFNLDGWKSIAYDVFYDRIQNFEISESAYDEVNVEMLSYLRGVYKDYIKSGKIFEQVFKEAEEKKTIPPLMLNVFKTSLPVQIENLEIERQLPGIARVLTNELKKREPKIKSVLTSELSKLVGNSDTLIRRDIRMEIAQFYGQDSIASTLGFLDEKIKSEKTSFHGSSKFAFLFLLALIVFSMVLFLVFREYRAWVIGYLSLVSLVALYIGVHLPMIVIDMRLNSFDLILFEKSLSFDQQSIFFQSKSILDVTSTLLEGRTLDLKIVGILVLCFSVVFPVIKLVMSAFYLVIENLRNNRLVKGMIFYLGKWSMADVFVVALFMAYIGFHGLADAQLTAIEHNKTGFAVETTNYTRLEKGALFFTTYCLLSIVIGIAIDYTQQKKSSRNEN
ncbi:MAG: paraquat-inducible protein A [Saprospiraceae bacterium]|nr:paraquat-inducible protein A [Saprospiraceae bacterium]